MRLGLKIAVIDGRRQLTAARGWEINLDNDRRRRIEDDWEANCESSELGTLLDEPIDCSVGLHVITQYLHLASLPRKSKTPPQQALFT